MLDRSLQKKPHIPVLMKRPCSNSNGKPIISQTLREEKHLLYVSHPLPLISSNCRESPVGESLELSLTSVNQT